MDNRYVPDTSKLEWVDDAACADIDTDVFFVDAGRVLPPDVAALCRRCPVRRACVDYAYDLELTSGYFGGLSPGQRLTWTREQAVAFIATDRPRRSRRRR